MAVETIPFAKLIKQSNDFFELVVAAAKRARQINQLRVTKYPLPTLTEEEETFEETPEEEDTIEWEKMGKVSTLALHEMLDGKINYRFSFETEEEESEGEIQK